MRKSKIFVWGETFTGMNDREYMTLEEVANYLRVNKKTIYRMIDKRAIPTVKVGRQWRFSKNSVDAWLSQNSIDEVASISTLSEIPL